MSQTLLIAVFILGSLALAWISCRSLAAPRSHGFFRFFAWEAILALTCLNLPAWFKQPLAPHQLISWSFLCVSAYLVVDAVFILRRSGKQDQSRTDAPMLAFEMTTLLVTTGVYRYIRHPMYSSLLFLAWGVFLKAPGLAGLVLAMAASGFLVVTAKIEEAENIRYFGEAYREYMEWTKRFFPFLY